MRRTGVFPAGKTLMPGGFTPPVQMKKQRGPRSARQRAAGMGPTMTGPIISKIFKRKTTFRARADRWGRPARAEASRRYAAYRGFPGGENPQRVERSSPKESLAEFLRPKPQESNENPSFPRTCALEMTLLAQGGPTFPSGIEVLLAHISLEKVAPATFSNGHACQTVLPPWMVSSTRTERMSMGSTAVGSAERMMRSACLPGRMEPRVSSRKYW